VIARNRKAFTAEDTRRTQRQEKKKNLLPQINADERGSGRTENPPLINTDQKEQDRVIW